LRLPIKSALVIDYRGFGMLTPLEIAKITDVTSAGGYVFVLKDFNSDAQKRAAELNKALRLQP